MILETAAWAATAAILLTYALTVRGGERHALRFHIANAIGCVPLAILNAQAGVWPALVVNLGFGVPAWVAVIREISRRRQPKQFQATLLNLSTSPPPGARVATFHSRYRTPDPYEQFLAQADAAYAHSDAVWDGLRDLPRVHDSVVFTQTPQEQWEGR